MSDISKAVKTAKAIVKDNTHGYDQENRLGPDYDCSSLVATALNSAGYDVPVTAYTGNLSTYLKQCGFKNINDTSVKAGDIFLTPGKHVVIAVSAKKIAHASINEKGRTTGGQTGDQTGKEICTRSFYTPSYGWKYHLRYDPAEAPSVPEVGCYIAPKLLTDILDGKYGVYPEREAAMKRMGLDYDTVQYLVNETIKANEGL